MKKIILIGLVVISCAMARDCRYEEQELNSLIRQYEDLQDDYNIEANQIRNQNVNDALHRGGRSSSNSLIEGNIRFSNLENKYNVRFNRLNQRIEQAKQQLNNCRRKK